MAQVYYQQTRRPPMQIRSALGILRKEKNTGSRIWFCNTGERINRLYLLMVPVAAEVGVLDAAVRHAVLGGQ